MSLEQFTVRDWNGDSITIGTGAPIVYLHGFHVPAEDEPFMRGLGNVASLHAPRLPGFGGASSGTATIHNIHDLALHVREFIRRRVGTPVTLIGHSLGGMIAAEVAIVSPDLVSGLVLVDSYGLWADEEPLPDPFILGGERFRRAVGHPLPVVANALEDKLWRANDVGASTRYLWPIPDRGLQRRAGFIQCPTLVVHGDDDPLIPVSYAQRLVASIPEAELEIIHGAGHAPMVDQSERFVDVVDMFHQRAAAPHAEASARA